MSDAVRPTPVEIPMPLEIDVEKRLGPRFALSVRFEAPGGVTALFGRSGAGKSSLVEMIAGLMRPDRGRIAVGGRPLFDSRAGIDLPPEKRRVGYVFQDARLFPHMTVRRNLLYGQWAGGRRQGAMTLEAVCRLLDIETLLDRRPGALSGGETQRVAIGRALLSDPALLLMDEPLASLDAPRKAEILPFLERLVHETGLPVVYVSHAMEEVIRLADTMALIDDGALAAVGPVEALTGRIDLPLLTGQGEAGAVVGARVVAHDADYALTTLEIEGGGRLQVALLSLAPGTDLRVRLRARDITLSLAPPEAASTLNVLPATVREMARADGAFVHVLVDAGAPLWARVTRLSADRLALSPGKRVHAIVKAGAIDRASLGGRTSRVPGK
ncbi:molybdenum ABC transporter ATP-binding protein [Marivibrio halodurans]|nr:molybdenum ABC transporter ATP-binding protein [Marivibrio halodurans]